MKRMKMILSLALAVACVMSMAAVGASAAAATETVTYTVTANLYVPKKYNEILNVNAYLTNPAVMPTSPVSNNATMTRNSDGTYTLSVPVANNTFALIDLGTPEENAGISNIVATRNTGSYGDNTDGRITNLAMTIEEGRTSVSFTDCHEYSGYFISRGDKHFNLQLEIDWSNLR